MGNKTFSILHSYHSILQLLVAYMAVYADCMIYQTLLFDLPRALLIFEFRLWLTLVANLLDIPVI